MTVVHDPGAFSSETGGDAARTAARRSTTCPVAGLMLNMMDDPRHQRVRLLVSKGLTPRMIARLDAELRHAHRATRRRGDRRAASATS